MINFEDLAGKELVRFVLNGELVAGGMDQLREAVKRYIDNGTKKITIDMKNVTTIDSAGVGFLAAVHNSLKKAGGEVNVVELSEEMYNFFISLRLNTHFKIEQQK
ncbi:MAG TPA: STAS domain-containing protein [Chitinispirillaceae bacterium]|nr:STAS domain-containing protein [Chitinispirillaceae bacterium]